MENIGTCGGCQSADIEIHECEYCDRECCSECGEFGEVVWCNTDACKREIERKGDAAREAYYGSMPAHDDEAGAF